jgi:hypothetical protein
MTGRAGVVRAHTPGRETGLLKSAPRVAATRFLRETREGDGAVAAKLDAKGMPAIWLCDRRDTSR